MFLFKKKSDSAEAALKPQEVKPEEERKDDMELKEEVKEETKKEVKEIDKGKKEEEKKKEGFKFRLFGRGAKKEEYVKPEPVILKEMPPDALVVEEYPIEPPYSKVTIAALPQLGGSMCYFINEIKLTEAEEVIFQKLLEIICREIEPPGQGIDVRTHIQNESLRLAKKYGLLKKIPTESWPRIMYYINRELVGLGPIHVIMNDRMIEDVSVNGLYMPVYVWHRKYESIPTNLIFNDEETLDNLIIKLTHLSQKHISTAFPVLDAMLPGKDRLAATFKREVSPKGGTFTIRRFREEPFSIVDLIELKTLDERIAAYFWLLIENRMTVAVIGGTGAGKTSTLNALASLIKPTMKIVTVEEIPEINLVHDNWVQLVSRESYGLGSEKIGEIGLFDLVKMSLRYRPDYIIVGEIRGEEAFVLFQALATGHGGMTTLHAESIEYAIKRLTSPPMNVAPAYVPLINVSAMQERVPLSKAVTGMSFGRRIRSVVEIGDIDNYLSVALWNPVNDVYDCEFENSVMLRRIAMRHGITLQETLVELEKRAEFLRELKAKGIRNNVQVSKMITSYYLNSQFPRPAIKIAQSETGSK